MRGLISLAVIFFIALSAQASAKKKNLGEKITVLCVGDITDKGSKDKSIPADTKFYLSYYVKTPEFQVNTIAYGNEMDCEGAIPYFKITDVSISFTCDIGAEKLKAFESYEAEVKEKTFYGTFREYRKKNWK